MTPRSTAVTMMAPHLHEELVNGKRSKVQLLCQLAQGVLAPNRAIDQDQVDLLSMAISESKAPNSFT